MFRYEWNGSIQKGLTVRFPALGTPSTEGLNDKHVLTIKIYIYL